MKFTLASIAFLTLAGTAAFAAPPSPAPAAHPSPAPNLVCPVTGEKIASVKDSVGSSVYKGKTYYFCCGGCKPMFDKNPAKYIKSASAKPAPKASPKA